MNKFGISKKTSRHPNARVKGASFYNSQMRLVLFLVSAASILSFGLQNASLGDSMCKEGKRDNQANKSCAVQDDEKWRSFFNMNDGDNGKKENQQETGNALIPVSSGSGFAVSFLGHIVTNDKMETNIKNIYAIGDVTSPPWLAHKASHEGVIVAEIIAGHQKTHKLKKEVIPGCTYSNPQIASIGLTEKQAKQKDIKLKIGKFPFLANGKSITIGDTEGIVKTIFNKDTGELIGAHLIGSDVTELINSLSVAKSLETTEIELMKTVFAHPTLSETLHESVLSAYDKAIHI